MTAINLSKAMCRKWPRPCNCRVQACANALWLCKALNPRGGCWCYRDERCVGHARGYRRYKRGGRLVEMRKAMGGMMQSLFDLSRVPTDRSIGGRVPFVGNSTGRWRTGIGHDANTAILTATSIRQPTCKWRTQ